MEILGGRVDPGSEIGPIDLYEMHFRASAEVSQWVGGFGQPGCISTK